MTETKECPTCNKEYEKNTTNFRQVGTTKTNKPIFRFQCRKCEQERVKIWRKEKPELVKKQYLSYKDKTKNSSIHIIKRMLKDAKKRAKRKNIEFNIKDKEMQLTKICPVLGLELKCGDGICSSNSPTIDRKDNSRGYTLDNVQIISFKANSIKGNATSDEIYKVALYAEKCEGKGNFFTRWLKRVILTLL